MKGVVNVNTNQKTLRTRFLAQLSTVLILVALISGVIQYSYLKDQISKNINTQANILNQGIQKGINDTETASIAIEKQIDRNIIAKSKQIEKLLGKNTIEEITNEELIAIKDELGLNGITLVARKDDDIIGAKSTDEGEIGFSFKNDPIAFEGFNKLLNNE